MGGAGRIPRPDGSSALRSSSAAAAAAAHPEVSHARAPAPVSVQRVDHAGLDGISADSLAVFCWSDVRPLSGTPGYIDWRICGGLSRLLVCGEFQGRVGEAVLLPVLGRFGPKRLFLFGLGPTSGYSQQGLCEVTRSAYEIMRRAGARSIVFAAPHARGHQDIESDFVGVVAEQLPHLVDLVLIAR